MKTLLVRPGIMVALKTRVDAGVKYSVSEKSKEGNTASWKTTRVTNDPDETTRATKARGLAIGAIRKVCSDTAFGLLCPLECEAELDAAILRAQAIADEHNASAVYTRVTIYALSGRIAETKEQAARAIGEEVRTLIEGMNSAIDALDPEKIRAAATKASKIASMLTPDVAKSVEDAIEGARKAARTLVKRVQKGGEEAAIVLKDIQRGALEKARLAFLDLDDAVEVAPLPAVAAAAGGVELDDEDESALQVDADASVAVDKDGEDWMAARGV